nr:MAG TPA: hypothetical protein [Caudoviricetes sp.]
MLLNAEYVSVDIKNIYSGDSIKSVIFKLYTGIE